MPNETLDPQRTTTSLTKSVSRIVGNLPIQKNRVGKNSANYTEKVTQKGKKVPYVTKWIDITEYQDFLPDTVFSQKTVFPVPFQEMSAAITQQDISPDKVKELFSKFDDYLKTVNPRMYETLLSECIIFLSEQFKKENFFASHSAEQNSLYLAYYLKKTKEHQNLLLLRKKISQVQVSANRRKIDDILFRPVYESIAGDLYRLIGDPDLTPKVRIITTEIDGELTPIASISKTLKNYRPATECRNIQSDNPARIIELLTSCHVLAELDLNLNNFGIAEVNGNLSIVKIDHDYSFYPFISDGVVFNPAMINTIYDKAALDFLSTWDITHFPYIHDAKPSNAIKKEKISEMLTGYSSQFISDLSYFNFTKSILLITELELEKIFLDHHVYRPHHNQLEKLNLFLLNRIQKLTKVLLYTPKYRQFLIEKMDDYMDLLIEHIEKYNHEICSAQRKGFHTEFKDHKKHREINIDTVKTRLAALKKRCLIKNSEINNNPFLELIFRFCELRYRYEREKACIRKVEEIMLQEKNPTTREDLKISLQLLIQKLYSSLKTHLSELLNNTKPNILTLILEHTADHFEKHLTDTMSLVMWYCSPSNQKEKQYLISLCESRHEKIREKLDAITKKENQKPSEIFCTAILNSKKIVRKKSFGFFYSSSNQQQAAFFEKSLFLKYQQLLQGFPVTFSKDELSWIREKINQVRPSMEKTTLLFLFSNEKIDVLFEQEEKLIRISLLITENGDNLLIRETEPQPREIESESDKSSPEESSSRKSLSP